MNKQCAPEMTSWRYLKNGLGLGLGWAFHKERPHREASICVWEPMTIAVHLG